MSSVGTRRLASAERWLVCGRSTPAAASRIYCLSHAGGSGSEFGRWSPPGQDIEIWGVRYPGRGTRLREKPYRRLDEMVAALLDGVDFVPPFGLFGHSMGGLVAFEVARVLRRQGRPGPDWLWVSACPAPHLARPEAPIHHLPDSEFLETVASRHGGMPAEVLQDQELAGIVLPYLRADHEMVESYVYRPDEPLACATHVLYATDDLVSIDRFEAWSSLTTRPPTFHRFTGGHFYINEYRESVLRLMSSVISEDQPPHVVRCPPPP
ncbi:Thioesterase [Micromonospora aurantiaca ATCC 27029]|nr:Thioesterase [Micromonospora aurantiaca ATCC 27029]